MAKKRRVKKSRAGGYQGKYHSGKKPLKKREKSKITSIFEFLLVISLAVAVGWFSYIDGVEVRGGEASLLDQIHTDADDLLAWQWQVNDSSIGVIEYNYRAKIASINYSRSWLDRQLYLDITPRQPVLIWSSGDTDYLMDEFGVITGLLSDDESLELPSIKDDANLPVEVGEQATVRIFVEFALALDVSERLDVVNMGILETTSEIYADLDEGYSVRFAIDEDIDQQIDNVKRVQDIAEDRGDRIRDYIDVRIPYKAYYR